MDKSKVFLRLKTKAASLGFNKKELWGIAEQISNDSELKDDATDEEVDEEIDSVLPYLRVGQQQANRIANSQSTIGDGDAKQNTPATTPTTKEEKDDDEPVWFRKFREQQEERLSKLESAKVADTRKSQLETLVKDSGTFGKRILRDFSRMKFSSDEEFEDYLTDVKSDVAEYAKDNSNSSLGTLTKPVGGTNGSKKDETVTDAEIDEVVANL